MKKAEFIGDQFEGKFKLRHQQVYKQYQKGLPNGAYKIAVTMLYPPKTIPQLGYYYAVVVEAVKADMIEQNGSEFVEYKCAGKTFQQKIDKDFVDEYIKRNCARIEGDRLCVAVKDDTRKVHSKGNMSKIQAMQLLDNAIQWCARDLHIVIPEPTEMGVA